MKKVLITEFMEQDSVDKISKIFEVTYDPSLHENHENLSSLIMETDAVIVRNKTQLTEELLLKANKLSFVGRLGVGLDNIDTDFCSANGIFVQPATGMNADSVAEYVITCALSLLKNIPIKYPRYPQMQRLTDLMINSFNAIGEADSARYYSLIIESMFPSIETNVESRIINYLKCLVLKKKLGTTKVLM